jgi:hypothetical protein
MGGVLLALKLARTRRLPRSSGCRSACASWRGRLLAPPQVSDTCLRGDFFPLGLLCW